VAHELAHLGGDMASVGIRTPVPGPEALGRRELALLELLFGHPERVVEHRLEVAPGDVMAEQILDGAQEILGLLADRELPPESPGRERSDAWGWNVYPRWRG
jgi:hypothetical protein